MNSVKTVWIFVLYVHAFYCEFKVQIESINRNLNIRVMISEPFQTPLPQELPLFLKGVFCQYVISPTYFIKTNGWNEK